ncbi:hypothetical protein, partial [Pseudomonas syringae group genomosp. 7]|uniref:hypothetical protein n=1 Tax=Pseudomonas syringae group genomosp. 7 TaxID=251699 RepID=UPI0037702D1E
MGGLVWMGWGVLCVFWFLVLLVGGVECLWLLWFGCGLGGGLCFGFFCCGWCFCGLFLWAVCLVGGVMWGGGGGLGRLLRLE